MNDSQESRNEIENLFKLNIFNEMEYGTIIDIFQDYFLAHSLEENRDVITKYILNHYQHENSFLFSMFFNDVFSLGTRLYYALDKEEKIQVILPALVFHDLVRFDSQFCSILGHGLQIDHEDSLGFAFSQIFNYLLSEKLLSFQEFCEILNRSASYTSFKRIGRLIANLTTFKFIPFNEALNVLEFFKEKMDLNDNFMIDLILGIREKTLSLKQEENLLRFFLQAFSNVSNSEMNGECPENLMKGLSVLMASDLRERKPLFNIIRHCLNLGSLLIVAETLKYLIDTLVLSREELIALFNRLIDTKTLTWEEVPSLMSSKFTIKEISNIILSLMKSRGESITAQEFIGFFKALYKSARLNFTLVEIQQILEYIDREERELVKRITGLDIKELIEIFKSCK
ncbi:MAG: hypothetical protein ACTSYF_18445 [Promethearchaeota archaeon]